MSKGRYLELDFNVPNIKTAKIVWQNGYYLYYIFDNVLDGVVAEGTNTVGIDLGYIHSVSSVTN